MVYASNELKRNFWRPEMTFQATRSYVSAIGSTPPFYSLFIYSHVQEGFLVCKQEYLYYILYYNIIYNIILIYFIATHKWSEC